MTAWDPAKLKRVTQQRSRTKKPARTLAQSLDAFLRRRVYPRQRKLGRLAQAWQHLLPETLQEHTCLDSLNRGRLKVLVDDAASLYELNLMKHQLLDQLRQLCPNAAPSDLRLVRGRWYHINEEGIRIPDYPNTQSRTQRTS